MGNFLEKPKTEKKSSSGSTQELSYYLSSMQGWRLEMEDAHTHVLSLDAPFEKWSFFAVFDGHAGASVAEVSSEKLVGYILDQPYINETLRNDSNLVKESSYDKDLLSKAIQDGFLALDAQLNKDDMSSGSTCTALLITPIHYFFINLGDSRSFLVRKDNAIIPNPSTHINELHESYKTAIDNGHFGTETKMEARNNVDGGCGEESNKVEEVESKEKGDASSEVKEFSDNNQMANYFCYYSTIDHKPYDEEEKKRIEAAGGMVIIQRINGALAVSRALGDFDYKRTPVIAPENQQVSPLPIIQVIDRTKSSDAITDSYIVLACDGIYDAITNENLVKYINYKMLCGVAMDQICKGVLDLCLNLGSRDNMSFCIVSLKDAPTKSVDFEAKEKEIEDSIVNFIDDKLKNDRQYDQVLNFASPQDKLFFDFYTNGTLKKLCGDNYIYSTKATAAATPTPTNTYVGGVVDKHRLIRKHIETLQAKKDQAKEK